MMKSLTYMMIGCAVTYVLVDQNVNKKLKRTVCKLKNKMM